MPPRLGRSRKNRGRGRGRRGRARGRSRGLRKTIEHSTEQEKEKSVLYPTSLEKPPSWSGSPTRSKPKQANPHKRANPKRLFSSRPEGFPGRSRSRHAEEWSDQEYHVRRDFDWGYEPRKEDKSRSYSDVRSPETFLHSSERRKVEEGNPDGLGYPDVQSPGRLNVENMFDSPPPTPCPRVKSRNREHRMSPERSPEFFGPKQFTTKQYSPACPQFNGPPMFPNQTITSWQNFTRKRNQQTSDSLSDDAMSEADMQTDDDSGDSYESRILLLDEGLYKEKNCSSWNAVCRHEGREYRTIASSSKRKAKEYSNWLRKRFCPDQLLVPNPSSDISQPKRVNWFSFFQGKGRHRAHGFYGGPIFCVPLQRQSLVFHLIPKLKGKNFKSTQVSVAPLNRNASNDTLISITGRYPKRKESCIKFVLKTLQKDLRVCSTNINLLIPSPITITEKVQTSFRKLSCTIEASDQECEFLPHFREVQLNASTKNLLSAVLILNECAYQGTVNP